jgi:outer membrane protein assembly factor BamB
MTGRMSRLLGIWRSWSVRRRAITAGVIAVAAAGLGVLAYELLKRPADVSNPDVEFVEEAAPKPSDPKDKTVDWPTYGYNDARTRYFPTRVVRPPFDNSDWSAHFGKLLEFSPIVVDDRIYMMDIESRFLALNAKTGKTIWERRVGKLNATSPAYSKGRLFATNLEPGQALALRAGDGKLLWRTPLPGRSESSPLAFKDKLVIFGCECGTVFALDQKSGKIKWTVDTGGAIKGALAQGGGDVYGGNYAGEAFAIDAATGRQEWRVNTIGGSFGRGGGIYSTPAVAFGRVYFGSIDSRVYSLDQDDGEIAWSQSTGAEVYSGPAVADPPDAPPTVYIGSADNNVYALNAETGDIRWQQNAGGQVTGAGSVIGDVAYFSVIGDAVGTLGYDVASGKKVFEHELGEYNPAITDGQRLYLTGYSTVRAFPPKQPGDNNGKGKKKPKAKPEG